MRKLMLLYLFSVLLLSCTKEGSVVSVEGRVYNPLTNEGVEGIEVKLIRSKAGGAPGAQSAGYTAEDATVSDANGLYQLKGTLGRSLEFYVKSSDYFAIGIGNNNISGEPSEFSTIGLKSGKHNKVDFWVVPYGQLRMKITNVDCQGEEDEMQYRFKRPFKDWVNYWSNIAYGCFSYNDPNTFIKVPMGWNSFEWRVTKNGITNYFVDSIYVTENGENIFEINY
jgi:hypothetical protein